MVCYKNANFTPERHSKQITRSIFKQTDHDNDFRIQFFEKFFLVKFEDFVRRLYQLAHHSFFFLASLAILEDKIYKTKGHDCEHNIAF